MKKILVYGLGSAFGGIENVVLSFINWVQDKDNLFFSIVLNDIDACQWQDKISNPNVEFLEVTAWGKNPIKFKNGLRLIIKNTHYDCIWINVATLTTLTFLPGIRSVTKSKIIFHAHGAGIEKQNTVKGITSRLIHESLKRMIFRDSDSLIACSEQAGRWMYGKRNFSIIKNGIDVYKFKFDNCIRDIYRDEMHLNGKRVIITIGRLTNVKNISFVIDTFNEIVKKDSNYILLIVGEGELKEALMEITKKYNIQSNVKFLGFRGDCNNLLNAADIFFMPSFHEGFPLVAIEAQCSGIQSFVSEAIPNEAIVTTNVVQLSLDYSPKYWADLIVDKEVRERVNHQNDIIKHKLDLDSMCNAILLELL